MVIGGAEVTQETLRLTGDMFLLMLLETAESPQPLLLGLPSFDAD